MKPFTLLRFTPLIFLFVMSYGLTAQTFYVKSDASGANDGTTWENAFTDFSEALDSASDGDMLWVAAGVYHPGDSTPDVNSVFAVRQNISIYGGFVGTEVNLEERDPSVNLTILSGDINEDDIEADFDTNRTDNTHHVLYIDSLLSLVIIDGLTIKGGQTTNAGNLPFYERAGGGIYSLSPVHINNCKFTGNFARQGGGILLTQNASNSSIRTCSFSYNKSTDQGTGISVLNISNIVIADCSFTDNETFRGALYPNSCRNVLVDNCFFENNHNTGFNGGALFSFQNFDLRIRHCQFNRNTAKAGGAIVINGGQIPTDSITNVRIENCNFLENICQEGGGAILLFTCPDILITKCEFRGDSASWGGGIGINQPQNYVTDTNDIRIDSCLFENNNAEDGIGGGALFMRFTSAKVEHSRFDGNTTNPPDGGGGGHIFQNCPGEYVIYRDVSFRNGQSLEFSGAISTLGKDARFLFESCEFSNNFSQLAGGAMHVYFGAITTFKNCMFNENISMARGGALSMESDSTKIHIEHSSFTANEAAFDGGAISSGFGSQMIEIDNCVLDSNRTLFGFGGAISMLEGGDDNIASLHINNSIFRFNSSRIQGGALHIVDSETSITNCVFAENECDGDGFGGAMAIKASDLDSMQASIINTTIVGNHGLLADGIAQEEETKESSLITKIQNCIFNRQGSTNYTYNIEAGTPELISLGGNMSDDESMIDFLTNSEDLNQTSPLFDFDYSLMSNSPGINAGVDGAPEFDILGNPRVGEPDMGAYENQMPVSVKENIYSDQRALTVYPNPVIDQNPTAMLMNSWRGEVNVQLSDLEGRVVYSEKIQKPDELYHFSLPMQYLNTGSYQLLLSNGQKSIIGNIVKVQ